jgi:hypothetical protein
MVIRFVYRDDMKKKCFLKRPTMPAYDVNRPLLIKSLLVCTAVLVAFSIGYPYSLTAAAGAVMLMLIGGVPTERVLEGVDWTLLLFFSGLFVVMHGVEVSGLASAMINRMGNVASYSTEGNAGFPDRRRSFECCEHACGDAVEATRKRSAAAISSGSPLHEHRREPHAHRIGYEPDRGSRQGERWEIGPWNISGWRADHGRYRRHRHSGPGR